MAIYKRRFIRATNWALAGILGLLGFSCDKEKDKEYPVMYGMPHADYEVKGTVMDKMTSKPMNDVQVVVQYDYYIDEHGETFYYDNDTVRTNASGKFESASQYTSYTNEVRVITRDDKRDIFGPDTTYISFKEADYKGGTGSWYRGKAEKEITIHLKEKEEEEDE